MARYYSPPGTYECIYKSVLEDPTFTNAEFRIVGYLATKPEGWVIHARQLAEALDRSEYEIETALTGLREKGYVAVSRDRDERGRFTGRVSRLRRAAVVKTQVSTTDPESASVDLTRGNGMKAQVGTTDPDYLPLEFRPPREDGPVASTVPSSDDGVPSASHSAPTRKRLGAAISEELHERLRQHYNAGDADAFCDEFYISDPLIVRAVEDMINRGRPFKATVNYANRQANLTNLTQHNQLPEGSSE